VNRIARYLNRALRNVNNTEQDYCECSVHRRKYILYNPCLHSLCNVPFTEYYSGYL